MATELAKAYVQIVPSAQGIKGSISNVLSGESESAGKSAGEKVGSGLVGNLKKIIVGAGIGTLLKETFSAGADFEQNVGGIETLFGDGAQAMLEKSAIAYKTAGLSANDYMETVMSFSASLKQSVGDDMETMTSLSDMAVIDMADNANKMGTSMDSIQTAYAGFAKQNYTMLDNLKLGYGGTKKEMERLLKDAEKISGQKYDIENLADVYNAIHVVQTELGITGTTSKEAEETFTGSMASMKASAENVLSALATGGDVTGALDSLIDSAMTFFNNNLVPMLGRILGGLPDIITGLLGGVMMTLRSWASSGEEMVSFGVELITGLAESVITMAPYLLEAIWNIATSIGTALLEFDWIGTANEFVQTLWDDMELAGAEIMGSDGGFIGALFQTIQDSLPEFLENGVTILTNIADGILSALPTIIETGGSAIISFLDGILSMLPSIWESAGQLISNLVQGLQDNLPQIVSSASTVITNFIQTVLTHLPQLLESGVKIILNLATGIVKSAYLVIKAILQIIVNVVKNFKDYDWKTLGKNLIDGIINGVKDAGSKLWDALKEICTDVLKKVKEFFKIGSPSKVMADQVGKWLPEGIAVGVMQNASSLTDSMEELATDTVSAVNGEFASGLNTSYSFNATASTSPENEMIGILSTYLPIIAEKCGITLEANARGIFNLVVDQNAMNTRATGKNVLAY